MKKNLIKVLFLFVFVLISLFLMSGKVSADYVIGNTINVRSGPGTNYSIVTTISRDDKEIKVLFKTGDWSKVTLANGTNGYIKSSLLRQRSYMKSTTYLNVRSSASLSSSIIETLNPGDVVAIIRYGIRTQADENANHRGWYRIYDLKNGKIGWVVENYLEALSPRSVGYNSVNLRSSTSSNYTTLKVLNKNDHIYVIERNSSTGWSKVVSNGVIGYIKNSTYTLGGEYVYITTLTSHVGRNKNIQKAANLINGKKIYSGQVFSYLSYLGQVTQAGGYYQAPEIINGVTVENNTTYGGGICQVSSTLYNALMRYYYEGTVSILERRPHSTRAKYVPYNKDAMVSYNSGYDFRFSSTLNLKISAEVIGSSPKRLAIKVESF